MRVPHNRLTHGRAEAAAVQRVVRSGQWAQGEEVAKLEQALARLGGVRHAVCLGSGIAALRLALLSLGVGAGDRVWVPGYSCVALPNAVLACRAMPVPVDVDAHTWCMVAPQGPPAAAAMVVHTFGAFADLPPDVPVVEDVTHAFGMRPVMGRVAVLSMYATKLVAAGEGGALLTDDDAIARFARQWRDYSNQAPDATRMNDKMTDLEAALGNCQIARLEASLRARRARARVYHEGLTGAYRVPLWDDTRVWYRFAVGCDDVDHVAAVLAEAGVETARPVHPWLGEEQLAALPNTRRAFASLLSLPLYPTLTRAEQDVVLSAMQQAAPVPV